MINFTAPMIVVRDIMCNIHQIEIDVVTTAACKEWQTFHSIKTHHARIAISRSGKYNFVNS